MDKRKEKSPTHQHAFRTYVELLSKKINNIFIIMHLAEFPY